MTMPQIPPGQAQQVTVFVDAQGVLAPGVYPAMPDASWPTTAGLKPMAAQLDGPLPALALAKSVTPANAAPEQLRKNVAALLQAFQQLGEAVARGAQLERWGLERPEADQA